MTLNRESNLVSKLSNSDKNDFIARVYRLFIYSLLIAAITSFIGVKIDLPFSWWWVTLEIVVLLVCIFFQDSIFLLFLWTSISGFTSAPILNDLIKDGNENVIWQAILATVLMFIILSFYIHNSKKDFSSWFGLLIVVLTLLILCSILLYIFPSDKGEIIFASISILIFSAYVLFDTSNIIHRYGPGDEVSAALDLHLDFSNLFMDFMNLFRKAKIGSGTDTLDDITTDADITDLLD